MKKILSTLLVLCMLVGACALFSACGQKGISEKELKKDPAAVVETAMTNTTSAFFADATGADKVLEKALKKGSVNIALASEELEDLSGISGTLYIDEKAAASALELLLTYAGKDYTAALYAGKDAIAVQSPSILGNENTYALNIKTFVEKLEGSALAEMMGMTDEDIQEILDLLTPYLDKTNADMMKEWEAFGEELLALVPPTITTETVKGEDDKEREVFVVTYKIDNDTVVAMLDALEKKLTGMEIFAEATVDIKETFDEAAKAIKDEVVIDLTATMTLEPKTGKVSEIAVKGEISVKEDEDDEIGIPELDVGMDGIALDLSLTFTDERIALTGFIEAAGQKINASLTVDKEDTEEKTVYTAAVSFGMTGVTIDLLDATYTYDKKSGDITLSGSIFGVVGEDPSTFELKANLAVSKTEVAFKLVSVKLDRETVFEADGKNYLTVTFKTLDKIPTMPEKTVDIMDLTEEDWEKLEEDIMSSPLFEVIGDAFGSMGDDYDSDYDSDYDW